MKKLIAILAVLVLCVSLVPAALAEVNWADIEPTVTEQGWAGEFVTLEQVGLKIWIPTALQAVELTEEDTEAGYIAYFMTEDESAALGITLSDAGDVTEETLMAALEEAGMEDVSSDTVNGATFIFYSTVENDVASNAAALVNDEGYVLQFIFASDDEGFEAVSAVIVASIQPAE